MFLSLPSPLSKNKLKSKKNQTQPQKESCLDTISRGEIAGTLPVTPECVFSRDVLSVLGETDGSAPAQEPQGCLQRENATSRVSG